MSKYIKLDDAISFMNLYFDDIHWGDKIYSLPTIEPSEDCISRSEAIKAYNDGGRERMTNADCIRKMSDEQLDEFLAEWECGDIDYSITFCDLCQKDKKLGGEGNTLGLDCDGCRKHWLLSNAVETSGLMYWKRNTTFDSNSD